MKHIKSYRRIAIVGLLSLFPVSLLPGCGGSSGGGKDTYNPTLIAGTQIPAATPTPTPITSPTPSPSPSPSPTPATGATPPGALGATIQ